VEEMMPTNRGMFSKDPVKVRLTFDVLSQRSFRLIGRESSSIQMERRVRVAQASKLPQDAAPGEHTSEAEEIHEHLAVVPRPSTNIASEPREDSEVLDISPIRTCYGEITLGESVLQEQSEWVQQHMAEFSKLMGVDIEGFESEAIRLFAAIERRWRQNGGNGAEGQTTTQKSWKGLRELRNLASAINYESSHKVGGGRRIRGSTLSQ
jgi:hypothetical protein